MMRYAIMGTGDIGARYGGRLAASGLDVTFIARGERFRQLKNEGLHVAGNPHLGGTDLDKINVTDCPASVGPVDVVVFAVKSYQLDQAANDMKPLIGPETVVLPLQNGVTAPNRIAEIVGREHVLGFASWMPNAIGELDGPVTPRVTALHAELKAAGWNVEAVDNIWEPLWLKLCTYATFGPMIVSRLNLGEAAASPEIVELYRAASDEVAQVARAEGISIPDDFADKAVSQLITFGNRTPESKQSLTKDLEAGRRLEVEDLIGTVVHKAEEHGVDVPTVRTCYMLLKPHESGRPLRSTTATSRTQKKGGVR